MAISALVNGIGRGHRRQILHGVTGSGKTLTMAHVVAATGRSALILTHNKTLATQLHHEFRALFPDNEVYLLTSPYVAYRPETYRPRDDEHIEKRTRRSREIAEEWRAALDAITSGRAVIIIATSAVLYDKSHLLNTPRPSLSVAVANITDELEDRLTELRSIGQLLPAATLEGRVTSDLSQLSVNGKCLGMENYARHLSGRKSGQRPQCLLDCLPLDSLVFIDESHVTIPQLRALVPSGQRRLRPLIDHGYVLPSALDNRPVTLQEFEDIASTIVYVSATPGNYERQQSGGLTVEQVIRPTGLLEPTVEVHPTGGQTAHLTNEIRGRAARGERTLVSTVTQDLAEVVSDLLNKVGLSSEWLHAERNVQERERVLADLRRGNLDAVVGANLLREGLDLPEVSLVAVLSADEPGFLRTETALIQLMGRAARHKNGTAVLYADQYTTAIRSAVAETNRRRQIQLKFNRANGMSPKSVVKQL